MSASIVAIGTEILTGETLDTNSNHLALALAELQIPLHGIQAIPDTAPAIERALRHAFEESDLVITTGGLGPTIDDITRRTLAEYFGRNLLLDQAVLEKIKQLFHLRGREMLESHRRQALVPEGAEVLDNQHGTAPGLWMEQSGQALCALPGVPSEVRGLAADELLPRLRRRFLARPVAVRRMMFAGIRESHLAHKIQAVEEALPPGVDIAYLPHNGVVKLRLTASGSDEPSLNRYLDTLSQEIAQRAGEYLYSFDGEPLPHYVGRLLRERGETLAVAESCSGGYLSHLVTSIPGASAYFQGAIVAYHNHLKTKLLGVQPETLEAQGAVSEETVREMAQGVRERLMADYGVAISGVAGPGGGSEAKPVGTVWMAAASHGQVTARRFQFTPQRDRNIMLSGTVGLDMLRRLMTKISV